jgi:hypothetical protein
MSKKLKILAVICLATFSGFPACLAGQLQVVPESKLYKVSTTQIAYQVSTASPILYIIPTYILNV